jgi:hypothetical protein
MQQRTILKIYVTAFLATVIVLLLFIFLNHHFDGKVWNGMQISKSALTVEYCEFNQQAKLFHQSSNTYSNLAYFFLGMIVVLVAVSDRKHKTSAGNPIQKFPLISFFFGCCLIYLCFGSAFFHASLTWIGQRIDMNATYSICIALSGISGYRLFAHENTSPKIKLLFVVVLMVITITFLEIHLLIPSIILLPLLIGLTTILTIKNYLNNSKKFNLQLAVLSLFFMIAAFVLRTMDVQKIGCDPMSVFQGHAIWHILTGMSAFLLYWFYRSEKT